MLIKPFSQLWSFLFCFSSNLTLISIATPIPHVLSYQLSSTFAKTPVSLEAKDNRWGDPHTGSQTGGEARGDCPVVDIPLTALIPDTHWGKSISQTPTIWFYVPYSSEQITYGEFVLQDEQGFDVINPVQFTLPETPGFVGLALPESIPVLETETTYAWAFQLYCNSAERTPVYVEGWIQRVTPTEEISSQLDEETTPTYQVYWENAIWFDAVDELIQQRLAQPSNRVLQAEWIQLLEDGGLDITDLSAAPILGLVLVESNKQVPTQLEHR